MVDLLIASSTETPIALFADGVFVVQLLSPTIWLGEATAAAVDVNSSDTASGLESELLGVSSSDTGAGLESELITVSSSDTGAGVDDGTVEVLGIPVADNDTGSAVESSSLSASVVSEDTGSGIDSGSVVAALSSQDTSSGTDSGVVDATLTYNDAGTLTEDATVLASVSSNDTGSMSESEALTLYIDSSDIGTVVEDQAIAADITDADSAAFSDTQTLAASLMSTDTGTSSESSATFSTLSDGDLGYVVDGDEFGLAVWPDSVFFMPSVVEILRQRTTRTDGVTQISWHPLNSPDNAGWFPCRFDLQFVRPGRNAMPPVMTGVQQDRVGVLFADVWVTSLLRAGDRVRAVSGPINGTFDVRNVPEKAIGMSSAHHLEIEILEVSQRGALTGTYVPDGFTVPSGIRHLYASRVEVIRRVPVSRNSGASIDSWAKITDIVDVELGVPGEMLCRVDLQFLRTGKDLPLPMYAGRVQDRYGTLICDITEFLLAGDRIRCIEGDVDGIYEIKAIPDLVPDFASIHHIECQIVEVAQNMAGVVTS